jgi:hypothetical protein
LDDSGHAIYVQHRGFKGTMKLFKAASIDFYYLLKAYEFFYNVFDNFPPASFQRRLVPMGFAALP